MTATRLTLWLCLISSVAAATAAWWLNGDRYTANVLFRVAPASVWLIGRDDYEIYKSTQQQLIRSDYVIRAALRDPDVKQLSIVVKQKDADRWLAQHIVTSFPRDGEVMNVSVTADTPDEAALLTASVAIAYIKEVVNQGKQPRRQRLRELQNALREMNEEPDSTNQKLIDQMDNAVQELKIALKRPNRVTMITGVKDVNSDNELVPEAEVKLQQLAGAIKPRSPDPNPRLIKAIGAALVGFLAIPLALIVLRLTYMCLGFRSSALEETPIINFQR